jgi:putative drug exporter of the RND superfamily
MSHVSEIGFTPQARGGKRPVPAGRLARVLRWLRWPLVVGWLVAAVALYPVAHSLGSVANNTAAANLPSSAASTRVLLLEQAAERGQPETDTATVVLARGDGLTGADLAAAASAHRAVARLAGHVGGLGAPGPEQRSADGQAGGVLGRDYRADRQRAKR